MFSDVFVCKWMCAVPEISVASLWNIEEGECKMSTLDSSQFGGPTKIIIAHSGGAQVGMRNDLWQRTGVRVLRRGKGGTKAELPATLQPFSSLRPEQGFADAGAGNAVFVIGL